MSIHVFARARRKNVGFPARAADSRPYDRRVWLPLEGKLSQPIPREAATDEVEPAAFDGP